MDALGLPLGLNDGVRDGDGREQRLGIGVERVAVQLLRAGDLHDLAQIHDGHTVRDVLDHGKIVGHEQVGQAHLLLQADQHVDDLCLNGNVQRRDGLVHHEELGLHGQGTGNADALALAAGELVDEAVGVLLVQAHFFQQAVNFLGALGLVLIQVVDIHALGDDIADGHAGVQGSVRVLEDHLSLPLIGEQLTAFQGVNVLAPVEHLSIGLVVHAQAGAAAGGLAAAGLAHQAQRLALTDAERNVVHRVQGAAMAEIEVFFQVADFQHNIILHSGPPV